MNNMPFKNYEEFKEFFVREVPGKGRELKNKALLAYLGATELRAYLKDLAKDNPPVGELLTIRDMAALYEIWDTIIQNQSTKAHPYVISIMGNEYGSDKYKTDGRDGICLDGDIRAYRYVNVERDRIFKMKIGKLYKSIIQGTEAGRLLPEPVVLYMCEEMTRQWEAWATTRVPSEPYELHVDDDFYAIYDGTGRCKGDFGSCMRGGSHSEFYTESVTAKAAYLTDAEGRIVARCIIFTEVKDDKTGEILRLAERQYSSEGDEMLKRLLIQKLIDGGHIDGYKKMGASCSDSRLFVSNSGESWADRKFSIECTLEVYGGTVSYQDSFKYYNPTADRAYNYSSAYHDYALDTTSINIYEEDDDEEEGTWDEYHQEYIHGDTVTAIYNGHEIEVDEDRLGRFTYCEHDDIYCYDDEVVDTYDCGYVPDAYDHWYSNMLDRDYRYKETMEEDEAEFKAEHPYYAEYDDEWFGSKDDLARIISVDENQETKIMTIGKRRLHNLIVGGSAIEVAEDFGISTALSRDPGWKDSWGCHDGFETIAALAALA